MTSRVASILLFNLYVVPLPSAHLNMFDWSGHFQAFDVLMEVGNDEGDTRYIHRVDILI